MGRLVLNLFLLPGNIVGNLLHAAEPDDRMMIRTMVNMLVWNIVIVVGAFLLY
ncbi:hypothetical protein [Limobrevibacterium gyesilva]|uniref:Uncharacterized protein n=1 Tax=Limobrevibacterium gyesilva TaxID=2991712 RepID=A0AA41YMC6_9PROT|nr:hypothetical protein [Limobrevibacterium gyesilva]MCW3475151.1 hypothetical protein [Limobrevibacterium gyesilva]